MSNINPEKYNLFIKPQGAEDTDYKPLGCVIGYENLMHKGTRDLKGNNCKNIPADGQPDDNGKRLKAKKFDNGSVTYIYDNVATDGRKTLNDAFNDEDNDVKLTIKLVLDDKIDGGVSGTYIERDVLVSSVEPIPNDDDLEEKVSLEFLNAPRTTDKVDT